MDVARGRYFGRPYPSQGKPLWFDALTSLRRILIGFAGGTVIGVALGAGMSASRVVRHAIDPVIEVLRPLPPLAFIPLFMIAIIALVLDACLRGLLLLADPSRRR